VTDYIAANQKPPCLFDDFAELVVYKNSQFWVWLADFLTGTTLAP
jgi:hypothetical protein